MNGAQNAMIARLAHPSRVQRALAWSVCVLLVSLFFFAAQRVLAVTTIFHEEILQAAFALIAATVTALIAAAILHRVQPSESSAATRIEHERFLAAAESSLDDFYIFDGIPSAAGEIVDFRFSHINPNAERRLKVQRGELLGKVLTEVRPFMITSGLIEKYREVVRTGASYITEVFIDDEMIQATWLNVQVVKLGDGIAITSRDVTERKRLDDQVTYLAHYDQLTGLPNRTLLQDRLRQAILRASRYKQKIAIFLFDIDRFKSINDTYGHAEGDALLAALGKSLFATMRKCDTIARMGGDEFVVLMQDFHDLEDVTRCGLEIVRNAARPLLLGDHDISTTISAGVCVYPDCGLDPDQLLRNADLAMYSVKKSGGNGLHIYSEHPAPQELKATSP
ncbi:sensor domain-containing diguanylate cyclase [Granulicella sibirica]|uniref:Diguanylate cyclase/phosphodiesterase (GGDEF & EAL domains) with PAS/PAC sensor(S) n=1 Tax=Granulicella sibirica TaxID=2479048 RepID=A0A4Q0SW94_9BACT|nr:sensor domain-containing diguanylate cyclase [Granulicella sibirica]RXH55343.1 diguanylate cyclase/phosphodiesterase (GGDEF & EAL domains) with PAS/PAC sensor(s) [Granulicella sibirica]